MNTALLCRRLRRLLATESSTREERWAGGWFLVAMGYATACACVVLRRAFASPYVVADDAREHVFWMFRYIDPTAFPHDPVADYFQSLAPSGYAALYQLLAQCGVYPVTASKLLPPVLSIIAALYFFRVALRFFRSEGAAGLTTILFVQALWANSDLASATPRAFFYPLFVAFLYFHMNRRFSLVLLVIALEVAFFPPAALLSLGVLAWDCLAWRDGRPRFRPWAERSVYWVFLSSFCLILALLLPYFHAMGASGPLISFSDARELAEFGPKGRVPVFFRGWVDYWVQGNAGIHGIPTRPPWFVLGFLWPLLRLFPKRFPSLQAIPRGARPIPQMIGAALLLFALAHLLLFQLYLPNRYTQSVTRILLTLLAGGVLCASVDGFLLWLGEKERDHSRRALVLLSGAAVVLLLTLAGPLLFTRLVGVEYVVGRYPALYEFLERQPSAIRIATLSDEGGNLPCFVRRSVTMSAECAVPFHPQYYLPLRDRGVQMAKAQYSGSILEIETFLQDQAIDLWILDRNAFSKNYAKSSRLFRQLGGPVSQPNFRNSSGVPSLLEDPPDDAIVYQDGKFQVLDAHRLQRSKQVKHL
jgi:hypothetical protein